MQILLQITGHYCGCLNCDLGIFILSDKLFKYCYEEVKKKFFRATNGIFSNVGTSEADLL